MKTNLARTDAQHRADLISNIHYTIEVDVTGAEQFTSRSTVTFDSKEGDTFFDLVADEFSASLDGAALKGRGLRLTPGRHELVVDATITYNRTGEGLHKFTDPVDGKDYLYTQFEPAMAMKVFAGFDQPDLKATYNIRVTAPERYTVVLNEAATREGNTWSTRIDYPLSTYLIAIVAGEEPGKLTKATGTSLGHTDLRMSQTVEQKAWRVEVGGIKTDLEVSTFGGQRWVEISEEETSRKDAVRKRDELIAALKQSGLLLEQDAFKTSAVLASGWQ